MNSLFMLRRSYFKSSIQNPKTEIKMFEDVKIALYLVS